MATTEDLPRTEPLDLLKEVLGSDITSMAPITDTTALLTLREEAVKKIAFSQMKQKRLEQNTADDWDKAKRFLWGAAHVEKATEHV